MKSVLISIQPKWVEKICHKIGEDETGKAIYEKRIEVRKSAPQEVPFKAYIYCCKAKPYLYKEANPPFELFLDSELYKGNGYDDRLFSGKVIGEFICDKVYPIKNRGSSFVVANEEQGVTNQIAGQSCLYYDDMVSYFGNKDGFGWHISDLKIYDKPRDLSEFRKPCDWNYDCCTCKRAKYELTKAEAKVFYGCDSELTRPPQSWQYIEDLGEEK